MSTATLPAANSVVSFSNGVLESFDNPEPKKTFFERGGRQVLRMENVAVFRSGTFRDSIGRQMTWEPENIDAFVANFNNLKANGVFPDVPVRKGHPQFGVSNMDGVIGYITALRAQTRQSKISGQEFNVLFADYEILRTDAQESIDTGLWRNRSAEVGIYTDNNDVDHAPVFMGFAYVDIPAVERLNEFSKPDSTAPIVFSHLTEEIMSGNGQVATPPAVTPAQPAAPAPQPAAPVSFSINGAATTDYAAVQQYITALEQQNAAFAQEAATREAADREAYVRGLAGGESPKLLAAQLDPTLAFAKSLSAEQFASWKATMDTVAPAPVLAQHGVDPAAATSQAQAPAPADAAFETAKQIVTNLAKAGVSHDQIKSGDSYAKVIAKDPQFKLPATGIGQ